MLGGLSQNGQRQKRWVRLTDTEVDDLWRQIELGDLHRQLKAFAV
jgi:hypothetical protein